MLLGLMLLATPVSAERWDDPKLDVELDIPGAPAAWTWLKAKPDWQALGIVRGATRVLPKSKSGKSLSGVGGLMHLAVRDLPEGMTLATAIKDPAIRGFLLKRFGATKPTLVEEQTTVAARKPKPEHPAAVLRATGVAPGLAGGSAGKPCYGSLLITIARGRLYLMRTYAFTTPSDAEGLELDVDFMEGNALGLLDTTPLPKPKKAPPKAPPRKPELIKYATQGWRMTKHAKLVRGTIDAKEEAEHLALKFTDGDNYGGYALTIYAEPRTARISPIDLAKWIAAPWWEEFTAAHPTGAISTFAWPAPGTSKNPTFLTLPDLGDASKRVKVLGAGGKTGRKQLDDKEATRLIKKTKCCGPAKMRLLGTKGRVSSVVRGILHGTNEEGTSETMVRVAWRSKTHTYMVFLVVTGEGWKKWGDALRATLESIEFGVKK